MYVCMYVRMTVKQQCARQTSIKIHHIRTISDFPQSMCMSEEGEREREKREKEKGMGAAGGRGDKEEGC